MCKMTKEKKKIFYVLGKQQLVLTMMMMITNEKLKRKKRPYVHVCIFILRLIEGKREREEDEDCSVFNLLEKNT
jgi:hypothetical protein